MSETWTKHRCEGARGGFTFWQIIVRHSDDSYSVAVQGINDESIADRIIADHSAARALEVAKKALELIAEPTKDPMASWSSVAIRRFEIAKAALASLTPSNPDETQG